MELQSILADIHALEENLLAFERKYGVRSEIFYAALPVAKNPKMMVGCWISANGLASTGRGLRGWPSIEMKRSRKNESPDYIAGRFG